MKSDLSTAVAIRHQMQDGTLTAQRVVAECLENIEARDRAVRAWAYVNAKIALREAKRLDGLNRPAGPLHGIPVGIKDIIDTADQPTEYNSPIYKGHRPLKDAECVARLRAAGAVILGKTQTSEFAGFSSAPTRNPHNLLHTPGGSSSGSAAAVGSGMVPLALGSQTGGSTIRPASYCGAFALKPTYNRISVRGIKSLAMSYDTVGLFARTVGDLALLDSVLSDGPIEPLTRRSPDSLRIGLCETPFFSMADRSMQSALSRVANELRALGAIVEKVVLPDEVRTLSDGFFTIVAAEAALALGPEYSKSKHFMSRNCRRRVETGRSIKAEVIQKVRAAQTFCSLAVDRLFDTFDVLLTPAAPGEAERGRTAGKNEFNRMWTAMHLPCLAIPVGTGKNDLPIGIQLIGRMRKDRDLLSIGESVAGAVRLSKRGRLIDRNLGDA